MSATADAEFLKNFFNNENAKSDSDSTATILRVEGRQYPITIHYVNGSSLIIILNLADFFYFILEY